jgi:nucleoside-diphosphate-sugar epimerase
MLKTVLVTGASGFIGRYCLPILQSVGFEVHAVSSKPNPDVHSNVQWHQTDLLRREEIATLIEAVQPTHLLHLAWYAVPGRYWTSAENLRWVQASLELLQAFRDHGGERIVMAGTCAEYSWADGYCSERTTPLAPASLYGTCKHALRLLVEAYANQTNLSAAWARLFFLYGPFEDSNRLVASVVRSLLRGQPALCSSGNQQRDFLYVEDAASALVALLNSDVRGPVNIASGAAVSVKDVVSKIAAALGQTELLKLGAIENPPGEPQMLVADIDRLRNEVGWQPQFDLNQGLAATIQWWGSHLEDEHV